MFALIQKMPDKQLKTIMTPLLCLLLSTFSLNTFASYSTQNEEITPEHGEWLKEKFALQHQQLIPIVAVADMFYGCNKERKIDPANQPLESLVTETDKKELAQKLSTCLGDDEIKSDQALNFGLIGCFHEQLADLPNEERKQKMALVKKAILSLSRSERQKSFTKCVNAQAIHYLQ